MYVCIRLITSNQIHVPGCILMYIAQEYLFWNDVILSIFNIEAMSKGLVFGNM